MSTLVQWQMPYGIAHGGGFESCLMQNAIILKYSSTDMDPCATYLDLLLLILLVGSKKYLGCTHLIQVKCMNDPTEGLYQLDLPFIFQPVRQANPSRSLKHCMLRHGDPLRPLLSVHIVKRNVRNFFLSKKNKMSIILFF